MKTRAFLLPLLACGCVAVLDLDAQGESEGGAGGGSTDVSSGGGAADAGSGGTGGLPSAGGNPPVGGSPPCVDSSLLFSGAELLTIRAAEGAALNYDDKLAIGAWVRPSTTGPVPGDQVVLARMDVANEDGYALLLRTLDSGAQHPEFRFYVGEALCGCTGPTPLPPETWSHVAARFYQGHLDGQDAQVWVNGEQACIIECGDGKISKAATDPVVGASSDGAGGYFHGRIDDLYVQTSDDPPPPPMLDGGECVTDLKLIMPFDEAPSEGFSPDCAKDDITVALGKDAFAGGDEPTWEGCP